MKKNAGLLVVLSSLLLAITFCSNSGYGKFLTRNSSNLPNSSGETPIPVPVGGDPTLNYFDVTNSWTQNNQSTNVAANFIFVIDRSHSMESKVQALSASLNSWFAELETQGLPNFCVGVLSAVDGASAGVIQEADGHQCFCRDQMSIAEIKANFLAAIAASAGSTGSASSENPLYSLYQALTTKLSANKRTHECFSDDQSVVAVVMSDEQDAITAANDGVGNPECNGKTGVTQNGTTVAMNTVKFKNNHTKYGTTGYQTTDISANNYTGQDDCYEAVERLKFTNYNAASGKYVNTFTPKKVTDRLIEWNRTLPTYGNAIGYLVGTNPNFVVGESEGPFHGGFEFADLLNQDPIDLSIATPATQSLFNDRMSEVATNLITAFSFLHRFDLSSPVCATELDSVVVKVNGTEIAASKYSLNGGRNEISILPSVVFLDGDSVEIKFTKCSY